MAVREAISRATLLDLVRCATQAPSGHNTQPWLFVVGTDSIELLPDLSRRLPVVDADDHALYISLGAALENLLVAARNQGLEHEVEYFPASRPDAIVIRLKPGLGAGREALFPAIARRQSTRSTYDGRPVPAADLRALEAAAEGEDGYLRFIIVGAERDAVVDLVKEGNRLQMGDPAFVNELIRWIRFSRSEARESGDGIIGPSLGMPFAPRWLGSRIMKAVLRPEGQARQAEAMVRSSSALAVFVARLHDRTHWVRLGQRFERFALLSTVQGIRHAHVNMPCEVPAVREQFRSYLGLTAEQPLLLLRIGYGPERPRSVRRDLESVVRMAE